MTTNYNGNIHTYHIWVSFKWGNFVLVKVIIASLKCENSPLTSTHWCFTFTIQLWILCHNNHFNPFTTYPTCGTWYSALLAQHQCVKQWQATVDHVITVEVYNCIYGMSIYCTTSDMLVCSSMETKILYSNVSK